MFSTTDEVTGSYLCSISGSIPFVTSSRAL